MVVRRIALVAILGLALGGVSVALTSPADAASGTLTVTTLDRTGHSVRSQFVTEDVHTGFDQVFWTGAARRLPQGLYDVYSAIASPSAGDTVGVRRVRVSGAAHVTIDARKGRPVRGHLSPAAPAGFISVTSAWLCDGDSIPMVGGGSSNGPAYVIPSSLPEVEFAFSSTWYEQNFDNHGATYYAGAATHRNGAPAGMTRTFYQSNLTDLAVRGRTGLQTGDAQIDVRFSPPDECRGVTLQMFANATLPYTLHMHVPAGRWWVAQAAQDYFSGPTRQYDARHSYTAIMGGAAWGPSGPLPATDQYCRCLANGVGAMFADPAQPSGADARVSYTLKKGGTTIAQKTLDPNLGSFSPKLPSAGWYSLLAVGTRHPIHPLPSNVLSPRATLHLHFYADPGRTEQIGGFVTRFVPRGLSASNHTSTKSTTVTLKLLRPRSPDAGPRSDAVKSVSAWMSTNGGHTWHAVTVRHVNGTWWTTITNPSSGFVSLRSRVLDIHGNEAATTIVRAYAVG